MVRLLLIASVVAKIVMFRDAVKRGVPRLWFWLIAFMPAGEVIYFFVFVVDGAVRKAKRRRRPSGWNAERKTPVARAVGRGLEQAQAHYDDGRYAQAEGALELLLADEPSHPEALYLLAMARMQLSDPRRAVDPLRRLVDVKAGHRNYGGWLLLARAYDDAGDGDAAIAELERLVERSPRLEHHVLLAEQLLRADKSEQASDVLFGCRNRKGDAEWVERREELRQRLAI
jgi:hypothetical protein